MILHNATHSIYYQSFTPFEKLDLSIAQIVPGPSPQYQGFMDYWSSTISSKQDEERICKYFQLLELKDDICIQMLGTVQKGSNTTFPAWVHLLNSIFIENDVKDSVALEYADVPFYQLLMPFIRAYHNSMKASDAVLYKEICSNNFCLQLEEALIKKLSALAEASFQKAFEEYKSKFILKEEQDSENTIIFKAFVKQNLEDKLCTLLESYPMLGRLLAETTINFNTFISSVLSRFYKDRAEITAHFEYTVVDKKLNKVSVDIGDMHKGQSTLILELNTGYKLVYKPTSAAITIAYNKLIQWVSSKLSIGLKTFRVVDKGTYSWLEFVPNTPCRNENEVASYYEKAGVLLGLTYFLNSSDYHYENLIASGNCPVLIDHETLIQPKVKKVFSKLSEEEMRLYEESVLRTSLLPAVLPKIGLVNGAMSGFGSSRSASTSVWERKMVNVNTDRSTRSIKAITLKYDKLNKPVLNGMQKHLADYQSEFIVGFQLLYRLIQENKAFLLGKNSPLNAFKDKTIRYVWRATNIYAKIKQRLLEAPFLSCATKFGLRLELLAIAYLSKPVMAKALPILNAERQQMLAGDIPAFELKTTSKSLSFETGENVEIFDLDAFSYMQKKILAASEEDCSFQLDIIKEYSLL